MNCSKQSGGKMQRLIDVLMLRRENPLGYSLGVGTGARQGHQGLEFIHAEFKHVPVN